MKIYQLHPISGDFMWESVAEESPLEPGKYLIPAHSVLIPPLEFNPETEVCKWVGSVEEGKWEVFLIEKAIEYSEPLVHCNACMAEPTKEELEEMHKKELESLERKRTVLAKLGLTKEEIEDLLL
jgi:hypothetical protein